MREIPVVLTCLMQNTRPISARWLYNVLGIRQPYPLWLHRRVVGVSIYRQPDDYHFVQLDSGKDCSLSPTVALIAATSGGSDLAATIQVAYCHLLADHIFKGRSPIEVIETGIKIVEAEELLTRSFDPEKINE